MEQKQKQQQHLQQQQQQKQYSPENPLFKPVNPGAKGCGEILFGNIDGQGYLLFLNEEGGNNYLPYDYPYTFTSRIF